MPWSSTLSRPSRTAQSVGSWITTSCPASLRGGSSTSAESQWKTTLIQKITPTWLVYLMNSCFTPLYLNTICIIFLSFRPSKHLLVNFLLVHQMVNLKIILSFLRLHLKDKDKDKITVIKHLLLFAESWWHFAGWKQTKRQIINRPCLL